MSARNARAKSRNQSYRSDQRNVCPPCVTGAIFTFRRVDIFKEKKTSAVTKRRVIRFQNAQRIPTILVERFIERMEPIRMVPERLLNLGSAAGHLHLALRVKYPSTTIISLERDRWFCEASRISRWRRVFRKDFVVCGSCDAIPVPSASVDMVCANLTWVRAEELSEVLHECARVLRAPGLLMLVSYGPQTLVELRDAWSRLDRWEHTHRFADMHDIGDAMVGARLCDVVVDSERLTVEFDDMQSLLSEVRDCGGGNRATLRRRGLTSASVLRELSAAYADAGGYVTASVELVFAHAWLNQRPGTVVAGPVGLPTS